MTRYVYKRISSKVIIDLIKFLEEQEQKAQKEIDKVSSAEVPDGCCIENYNTGLQQGYAEVFGFLGKRLKKRT